MDRQTEKNTWIQQRILMPVRIVFRASILLCIAFVEVAEGLEPGEQVLTNGYSAYGDATELKLKQ